MITDVTLQQVVSGDAALKAAAELVAQSEITSYLTQKYEIGNEFTDWQVYSPAKTYNAADRVYLDADAYSAISTYLVNDLCVYNGLVYSCNVEIPVAEAFTAAHWDLLGKQYDPFYANYPYPVFDLNKGYNTGDRVFWNNHTYKALRPSRYYDHEAALQYGATYNLPYPNTFPDDPVQGSSYWLDEGQFFVPAGSLLTQAEAPTLVTTQSREDLYLRAGVTTGFDIGGLGYDSSSLIGWQYSIERVGFGTMEEGVDYETTLDGVTNNTTAANGWRLLKEGDQVGPNEKFILHFLPIVYESAPVTAPSGQTSQQIMMTYFTKGDSRNQQMVMYMLDIVIYHLYARILPKGLPEVRKDRYDAAVMWLQMAAKGKITASLTRIQPKTGGRIRYGSNVKNVNNY